MSPREFDVQEPREFLSRFRCKSPIVYIPNPGMAGDALLATATYQLFQKVGLDYHVVPNPTAEDVRGRTVLYGAGGNLIPYYTNGAQILSRIWRAANRLVVLPHTIFGHESLLKSFDRKVIIVCREPMSYEFARRHANRAEVCLMHDLAIGLSTSDLIAHPTTGLLDSIGKSLFTTSGHFPAPRKIVHRLTLELRRAIAMLGQPADKRFTLNAFRVDSAERTADTWPIGNIDVQWMFDYGTDSEDVALEATAGMLQFINRFSLIRTNRLHTAIAGALLSKRVELFPNNYFKCQQVFGFSLRDRFPNIRWMGESLTESPILPEGPAKI